MDGRVPRAESRTYKALCTRPAPSGHEKVCAVSRLRRRVGDLAAGRNALVGRQRRAALDLRYKQIEGALRMRLDQLELREYVLESLEMVPVLDLVEAVRRLMLVAPISAAAIVPIPLIVVVTLRNSLNLARIGARVMINRQ